MYSSPRKTVPRGVLEYLQSLGRLGFEGVLSSTREALIAYEEGSRVAVYKRGTGTRVAVGILAHDRVYWYG